ncbi:putative nucleotidyltransferase substrate binding domain-containing protein [Benzoatithermus flavus]|uniref:Nucleotidyltransferase substrate binding domain-containing protein n=1 Tax=Benzoatithermus flavus TaxID=3108223 RepID=A0ABU8XR49_9PROT
MPKAFDFTSPPFDRLRPAEVERVNRAVDIVFFRKGRTIIAAGTLPDHFYVVIKGLVEERDGEEIVTVHESGDGFDSGILVHQISRHDFVVREEAICYALPIEDFLELTANNPAFAAFFYKDLSLKMEAWSQRQAGPQALGALTTRVSRDMVRRPIFVDPATTLHEAAVHMDREGQRALLVRDGERIGIFTGVDLTRTAVAQRRPLDTPVRDLVHWEVLSIDEGSFLFEAALLMARRRVRHLAVRDESGEIVGVLDAANVLSSLANQADPIGTLIEHARTPAELAEASERIGFLIRQLNDSGTKIGFITELSTDLHRRIMVKLFESLAPPGLAEHACLVVMGSEGRGEYLTKTDQDNGIILADGYEPPDWERFRHRFTEAMIEAGFPPCPGEIMVRNPAWSKPLAKWCEDVRHWVMTPDEQALMNVAIFYDATAIAGDARLLDEAKRYLFDLLADNTVFHARFARAIDMFDTPLGFFTTFVTEKGAHKDELDLKKGGIFPLMHGVRALALEKRLTETNTVQRIRRLQGFGIFDQAYAQQLTEAFNYLLGLRLTVRLEKMRLHQPLDNFIRPDSISKLERDLLKDSLQIVKKFKELVRHHFHLGRF